MNFEEKYNGALERAKALCNDADTFTIYDITTIFPELEEEMIRKDIISYLRNEKIVKRYISDIEIDKWIAWLEKQKPNTNKREIDDAYLQGMSDEKHEIEKQGEKNINHTEIKEKAHQIAWETSKDYDPSLSKEACCEMAALDMASWLVLD